MKKPGSKKKIALIAALCLAAVLIAGVWAAGVVIYEKVCNVRYTTYEPTMLRLEDFDGLQRTRWQFPSDKGQMLTGYWYSHSAGEPQRGIVILAHGFGGGGHTSYMDCADWFARHGYYVFAYDATGNDESEGKGVGGLPQGVIDLGYAISFVEESGSFPALPIVLFGHSWGGYSVCAVLADHPEVKAVIECAGFNRTSDMIEAAGQEYVGKLAAVMTPFIKLHERIRFGAYASRTGLDGFAASQAAVLVAHSADDDTVPMECGYDVFWEAYHDDPRFQFLRLEGRGHNLLTDTDYVDEFNEGFREYRESLDYDYRDKKNVDRFAADKAEYIRQNLDRARYSHRLNEALFQRFLAFYDAHLS